MPARQYRKQPLRLTLLAENYNQLLQEFRDFKGGKQGDSSSNSDVDIEDVKTPPDDEHAQPRAAQSCSASKCISTEQRQQAALQQLALKRQAAAAPASPSSCSANKRPESTKPRVLSAVRVKQRQDHRPPSAVSPIQPKQQHAKARRSSGSSRNLHTAPPQPEAAAQSTKPGVAVQLQQAQQLSQSEQQQLKPVADKTAAVLHSEVPSAAAAPTGSLQINQHNSSQQPGPAASEAAPHEAAKNGKPAAAAAAQTPPVSTVVAERQPQQQQTPPKQKHHKLQRRRVGDISPNAAVSDKASASMSAAAAAALPGKSAAAAAPVSVPLDVLRLPLKQLEAPAVLPPLHPASARPARTSISNKASKSEPASARASNSNRTSDSGCSGVGDGSAGPEFTARQSSMPEHSGLPSYRRHSISCIEDASQQPLLAFQDRANPTVAGSDVGAAHNDVGIGSMQDKQQRPGAVSASARPPNHQLQQQQQPLQHIRQMQLFRRRSQAVEPAADVAASRSEPQHIKGTQQGPPVDAGITQIATKSRQGSNTTSLATPRQAVQAAGTAGPSTQPAAPAAASTAAPEWPSLLAETTPSAQITGHRRSRSSNTQLPPLDELAALSGTRLPAINVSSAAAAAAGADGPEAGADASSAYTSRRSSRTDSDASDAAAGGLGGALVCEPSSFGVCADPAGAVHLVTPTIPDKLARLKQRLPSRHVTTEIVPGAGSAGAVTVGAEAGGAAAATAQQQSGSRAPEWQGTTGPQNQPAPPSGQADRMRARWQLPPMPPPQQPPAELRQQGPMQQQQQQQQQPRPYSCRMAVDPIPGQMPQSGHRRLGGSQSLNAHAEHHVPQMLPQQSTQPPLQQQHQHQQQQQMPRQQQLVHPASAQQAQQAIDHGFIAELRKQLEQWASWVHLHNQHPQQMPPAPPLPPQLQQQYMQYQQHQQQQQQQQFQHQLHQGSADEQQRLMAVAAAPGGFIGPVPVHGALSRFMDPLAQKQQQRMQQQQHQQAQEPVASAFELAQQRRAAQQQAFEGLSLEAVLQSGKKPKVAGRRQMDVHA